MLYRFSDDYTAQHICNVGIRPRVPQKMFLIYSFYSFDLLRDTKNYVHNTVIGKSILFI